MRTRMVSVLAMTAIVLASVCALAADEKKGAKPAAATGSAVGTWKLNVAKSDFGKTPPPKQVIVKITEDTPTSLKYTVEGVDAHGKKIHEVYNGAPDGQPHPVSGSTEMESIAFKNENGVMHISGKMKNGMTMNETGTISPDNNEMTLKGEMKTDKGTET